MEDALRYKGIVKTSETVSEPYTEEYGVVFELFAAEMAQCSLLTPALTLSACHFAKPVLVPLGYTPATR